MHRTDAINKQLLDLGIGIDTLSTETQLSSKNSWNHNPIHSYSIFFQGDIVAYKLWTQDKKFDWYPVFDTQIALDGFEAGIDWVTATLIGLWPEDYVSTYPELELWLKYSRMAQDPLRTMALVLKLKEMAGK